MTFHFNWGFFVGSILVFGGVPWVETGGASFPLKKKHPNMDPSVVAS